MLAIFRVNGYDIIITSRTIAASLFVGNIIKSKTNVQELWK